jgi:hypothetical protein
MSHRPVPLSRHPCRRQRPRERDSNLGRTSDANPFPPRSARLARLIWGGAAHQKIPTENRNGLGRLGEAASESPADQCLIDTMDFAVGILQSALQTSGCGIGEVTVSGSQSNLSFMTHGGIYRQNTGGVPSANDRSIDKRKRSSDCIRPPQRNRLQTLSFVFLKEKPVA